MKNLRLILSLIASLLVLAFVHGTPSIEQTTVQDVGVVVCPAMDYQVMAVYSMSYTYTATCDVSDVSESTSLTDVVKSYYDCYRMYVNSESYRWPPSRYVCVSTDYYNRPDVAALLPERIRYGLNMALPVRHQRSRMHNYQRRL